MALPLTAISGGHGEVSLTPSPSAGAAFEQPDLCGFHVLVVDDEADARRMLERILASCHATVSTAASGWQAIEAVRQNPPDMILSDIGMPGEDGYDFLARLRRLPNSEGGDTPAVALTAFARPEDRRRALMAGFQMHLPKPVEPAELMAVASNIFAASRRVKSDA